MCLNLLLGNNSLYCTSAIGTYVIYILKIDRHCTVCQVYDFIRIVLNCIYYLYEKSKIYILLVLVYIYKCLYCIGISVQ